MALMTDLEKKEKFFYMGEYFAFYTCNDLSEGIRVEQLGLRTVDNKQMLSRDVSAFTAQWYRSCFDRLNGFPGFQTIKWNYETAKLMTLFVGRVGGKDKGLFTEKDETPSWAEDVEGYTVSVCDWVLERINISNYKNFLR